MYRQYLKWVFYNNHYSMPIFGEGSNRGKAAADLSKQASKHAPTTGTSHGWVVPPSHPLPEPPVRFWIALSPLWHAKRASARARARAGARGRVGAGDQAGRVGRVRIILVDGMMHFVRFSVWESSNTKKIESLPALMYWCSGHWAGPTLQASQSYTDSVVRELIAMFSIYHLVYLVLFE